MEADRQSIENVKFLLYCFEQMSRLKINFHKTEVVVIGATSEGSAKIAGLLNCREGKLPMKYLRVPMSDRILYTTDLLEVGVKVEKRLPAWQGIHLSSRGKSILIESSLSSLPVYIHQFYLLPDGVHKRMGSFFWDNGKKKKYHMTKWQVMARPKRFGGLGFTNTRLMNECLLLRWIVKLERGDGDLCTTLVRKKYLGDKGFTCVKSSGGS
jgi:hypothetical protein